MAEQQTLEQQTLEQQTLEQPFIEETNIKNNINNTSKNIRELPTLLLLPLTFSTICITFSVILSIYYLILIIIKSINQSNLNSPLNHETLDYESVSSNSFDFNTSFNYTYFLILPGLALFGILLFILIKIYFIDNSVTIPLDVRKLIGGMLISIIIVLAIQSLIFIYSNITIKAVKNRLDKCDKYVCNRIYKSVKFLELIDEPKESIISTNNAITDAFNLLDENISIEELAKSFYTISLFNHYQKLSLSNPSIGKAFEIFNPSILLSSSGCNPSKYFSRYGSYIEDISETIIRPSLPKLISKDSIKMNKAFEIYNNWIVTTNNLANSISPQHALKSFIMMSILTPIIQLLYIYIIMKMFVVNTDNDMIANILQKIGNFII